VIRDEDNTPQLINTLKELEAYRVDVGVFAEQDSHYAMVATVHEFGVEITVTPKMRAYLHFMGLHLRKDTATIKIPSRPFMRNGVDAFEKVFRDVAATAIEQLLGGSLLPAGVYERLGMACQAAIQKAMLEMKEPPLHPFTVSQRTKKSSQPLVDTGGLMERVTYMTVARGGD